MSDYPESLQARAERGDPRGADVVWERASASQEQRGRPTVQRLAVYAAAGLVVAAVFGITVNAVRDGDSATDGGSASGVATSVVATSTSVPEEVAGPTTDCADSVLVANGGGTPNYATALTEHIGGVPSGTDVTLGNPVNAPPFESTTVLTTGPVCPSVSALLDDLGLGEPIGPDEWTPKMSEAFDLVIARRREVEVVVIVGLLHVPERVREVVEVDVPSVVGLSIDEAIERLESVGLPATVDTGFDSGAEVTSQSPSPGTVVARGWRVYISAAPPGPEERAPSTTMDR